LSKKDKNKDKKKDKEKNKSDKKGTKKKLKKKCCENYKKGEKERCKRCPKFDLPEDQRPKNI